jgi:hypothetical protein
MHSEKASVQLCLDEAAWLAILALHQLSLARYTDWWTPVGLQKQPAMLSRRVLRSEPAVVVRLAPAVKSKRPKNQSRTSRKTSSLQA